MSACSCWCAWVPGQSIAVVHSACNGLSSIFLDCPIIHRRQHVHCLSKLLEVVYQFEPHNPVDYHQFWSILRCGHFVNPSFWDTSTWECCTFCVIHRKHTLCICSTQRYIHIRGSLSNMIYFMLLCWGVFNLIMAIFLENVSQLKIVPQWCKP